MLLEGLVEHSWIYGVDDDHFDVVVDDEEEDKVAECHDGGEYGVRDVDDQWEDVRLEGDDDENEEYGEYLDEGGWVGAAIDFCVFFADLALRGLDINHTILILLFWKQTSHILGYYSPIQDSIKLECFKVLLTWWI